MYPVPTQLDDLRDRMIRELERFLSVELRRARFSAPVISNPGEENNRSAEADPTTYVSKLR